MNVQGVTVLFCQKLTNDRSAKMQREHAAPKQSLTDDNCIVRESNPWQKPGKLLSYHYTNEPHINTVEYTRSTSPIMSKTDWRSESQIAVTKRRKNAAPKQPQTDDNSFVRESIPCQQLARLLCYHYTNDAHIKSCDYTRNSPLVSKTDWRS